MKKIICLVLALMCLCSCLCACNKEETPSTYSFPAYQRMSYTDFINFAMEKGYSPIENTDNIGFKFKKSFSIDDGDCYSLIFYELDNKEEAYAYFSYLMQGYGVYTAQFSKHEKFNDAGYYITKDGEFSAYFAFVDNTLIYSMIFTDDEAKRTEKQNELINFINFVQYPISQFPTMN